MKVGKTERGFVRIDFTDLYGQECSLQESSLATDDAIWLGCNEGKHPTDGVCYARMHLNREMVEELIVHLYTFLQTGELRTVV